jgi:hypothetical protein
MLQPTKKSSVIYDTIRKIAFVIFFTMAVFPFPLAIKLPLESPDCILCITNTSMIRAGDSTQPAPVHASPILAVSFVELFLCGGVTLYYHNQIKKLANLQTK